MFTPCKEEANMDIHQTKPESAILAMIMMIQQSATTDATYIKELYTYIFRNSLSLHFIIFGLNSDLQAWFTIRKYGFN